MSNHFSFFNSIKIFLFACIVIIGMSFSASPVFAKRPPEIRNQDDLKISMDMHGLDLIGNAFIKLDLRGVDFGESDLRAAIFNNSLLQDSDFQGADLEDAVAFACDFEGADLRNANFTQSLLMESNFENVQIEGADFTDAVLSRIQQKELCKLASGTNSATGVDTSYSLGC